MSCNQCNHKLVLSKEGLVCPKCNCMSILPKDTALLILHKRVDWFNNAFTQVLARFDKTRLIGWFVYYREKMFSDFLHGKPIVPIRDFLAVNALIKRVITNQIDGKEEANDNNTPKLIEAFASYIGIAENYYAVLDDYAYVFFKESFDINDFENKDYNWLMSNFYLLYNEDWQIILDTLRLHNITNEKEANKYFEENREKYIKASNPSKLEDRTIEETIEKLYPIMIQFFYGLQLNGFFKKIFDFEYLHKTKITPRHLLKIVTSLPEVKDHLNMIKPRDFKKFIKKNFNELDTTEVYNSLVFSKNNPEIFPIFIELEGHLFIPINTTKILALFLFPFIYHQEFISVHTKNSDDFEKEEVKEEFEKKGFKVILNFKDKKKSNLEIDLLVLAVNKLFVVEVKAWGIKPFFEGRRIHIYRERDLKGIVDGYKYTDKIPKKIPSLLEKMEFVKTNINFISEQYSLNKQNIKEISGFVITKSIPPIKEYKGVSFIAKSQIEKI